MLKQAPLNRRTFISAVAASMAGTVTNRQKAFAKWSDEPLFKISVAEFSLNRMIWNKELDPLDFGPFCKSRFDVDAIEYWMGPYSDKAGDLKYMGEMHRRSEDAGVKGLLIMCDIPNDEGRLGHPDDAKRKLAVEKHFEWVEAAKRMNCHSIRVNASSEGSRQEQAKLATDGLRRLSEFAAPYGINVIVENHGGLSSDGGWLAGVMDDVNLPNCGTLPDFGNFQVDSDTQYDRYQGVKELMPFAKAVSAKSNAFDAIGNEIETDYFKMMKVVLKTGYCGYVGIEWAGPEPPSEVEGVLMTKRLLENVRDQLS